MWPSLMERRTVPGICWSICGSPNGTCWSSAGIRSMFRRSGPRVIGRQNPKPAKAQWEHSVKAFRKDLGKMRKLVARSEVGFIHTVRAWRRADAAARGTATGRSQCVSCRGTGVSAAAAWVLEKLVQACLGRQNRQPNPRCDVAQTLSSVRAPRTNVRPAASKALHAKIDNCLAPMVRVMFQRFHQNHAARQYGPFVELISSSSVTGSRAFKPLRIAS